MPLCRKSREDEESLIIDVCLPLRGKAHEGEESPVAPVRILSASQILLAYYISCSRPYKMVFN